MLRLIYIICILTHLFYPALRINILKNPDLFNNIAFSNAFTYVMQKSHSTKYNNVISVLHNLDLNLILKILGMTSVWNLSGLWEGTN